MSSVSRSLLVMAAVAVSFLPAPVAEAGSPRNPYSGYNLSGINWGAQQWERDQRAGRVVWPYYNVPSRSYSRGGAVGGSAVTRATTRTAPRRWRR